MFQSTYNPAPLSGRRNNVQIEYLKLIQVEGYPIQVLRPNKTTMSDQVIHEVGNLVDNFNGKIPANAIAQTTSKFMLPSSRPETANIHGRAQTLNVSIPNGWADRRFVFIMLVKTVVQNQETMEMISGYTDRHDTVRISAHEEHIAPDTVFYINSISILSSRTISGINVPVIRDSYSVMGGGVGAGAYNNLAAYKMTPMNLIHSSDISGIDGLSDVPNMGGVIKASDYRNVNDYPTLTHRSYNSPTAMVSKVIESYTAKSRLATHSGIYDHQSVLDQARGAVADPSSWNSQFLTALSNVRGISSSTFDYRWLMDVDPFIDEKTTTSNISYRSTSDTLPWEAPTREALMAVVVSNMVTTLMTNYSLSVIEFSSTNMNSGFRGGMNTFGLQPITQVTHLLGFVNDISYRNMLDPMGETITEELAPILSSNGEIAYEVHVISDIGTDMTIEISFEGQQPELFIFPSFADSMISPLLTTNTNLYRDNAHDIGTMLNSIEERTLNTQQYNPQGIRDFQYNVNQEMNYGQNSSSDPNSNESNLSTSTRY